MKDANYLEPLENLIMLNDLCDSHSKERGLTNVGNTWNDIEAKRRRSTKKIVKGHYMAECCPSIRYKANEKKGVSILYNEDKGYDPIH